MEPTCGGMSDIKVIHIKRGRVLEDIKHSASISVFLQPQSLSADDGATSQADNRHTDNPNNVWCSSQVDVASARPTVL
jgi:hypothetical protein